MAMSHANCGHVSTPAARKKCRDGRFTPGMNEEIRMTGATARKLSRQAAKGDAMRIQPRKSGARVSASSSSCVQAALHTRGRCACGWEDWAA